ncbi:hypothetical protein [Paenibacillus hexagrammi]|uniref:Uncharacterized protein n=1 Tax=Paenibacillus hexagrammi TaxID=2908839 RepID=A0ABY3SF66_9BACL|nr:hypothetical protein [Paenibacillus sp. YPD9-1]UJF32447.1 hypothetical protein L0M14_22645 [Paenibacillus sp. YPD9-1]
MNRKQEDNEQFTSYLNNLLDEMPLESTSDGFTDRVMRQVLEESVSAPSASTPRPKAASSRRKSQLLHGLIASAATILFIQSGLIHKLVTIDSGINQLSSYIADLTHYLPS